MPNSDQLRFSRRVPDAGVNLAWVEIPPITPDENISLVEAGKFIAENINLVWSEALNAQVVGTDVSLSTVTGTIYLTTYNATPSATGMVSSGAATYAVYRRPTTLVSPSGFLVENFTKEIRVAHPQVNETGVWRMRLEDGVIARHHVLRRSDNTWLNKIFSPGDELVLFYSLPQADLIPYRTSDNALRDARVVEVSGIVVDLVDERTLQLPDLDLVQINQVTINGSNLILSATGIINLDTPPPIGIFTAWDPVQGQLTLNRSVNPADEAILSYRYREYQVVYEGYLGDDGVFHDLDLNPSPGHFYDGGRSTSELLNIPVYLYLLPTAAYKVTDSGGNFTQERKIYTADRWSPSLLRWERTAAPVSNSDPVPTNPCLQRSTFGSIYFGSARFVDDGTVEGLAVSSATGTTLANYPSAIVLAKLYVTSNAQIDNVKVIDTRTRGGGILETTNVDDFTLPGATRQEINTYWDVAGWDGQPVPLSAVVIVEIPSGVLTGANGYTQYSQDEIEAIVNQHIASGIKAIIRYI
jgi:hypothetical protein